MRTREKGKMWNEDREMDEGEREEGGMRSRENDESLHDEWKSIVGGKVGLEADSLRSRFKNRKLNEENVK
jgi:hypothetical protein